VLVEIDAAARLAGVLEREPVRVGEVSEDGVLPGESPAEGHFSSAFASNSAVRIAP
jgi:hypothetical protein